LVTPDNIESEFDKILESKDFLTNITLNFVKIDVDINESLPNKQSIDQLKKVMKASRKTDIGYKISDMSKQGANIDYIQNPINTGIESYEDYIKKNKNYVSSWNFKNLSSPFSNKKLSKIKNK
jgi:hypothetical protein